MKLSIRSPLSLSLFLPLLSLFKSLFTVHPLLLSFLTGSAKFIADHPSSFSLRLNLIPYPALASQPSPPNCLEFLAVSSTLPLFVRSILPASPLHLHHPLLYQATILFVCYHCYSHLRDYPKHTLRHHYHPRRHCGPTLFKPIIYNPTNHSHSPLFNVYITQLYILFLTFCVVPPPSTRDLCRPPRLSVLPQPPQFVHPSLKQVLLSVLQPS